MHDVPEPFHISQTSPPPSLYIKIKENNPETARDSWSQGAWQKGIKRCQSTGIIWYWARIEYTLRVARLSLAIGGRVGAGSWRVASILSMILSLGGGGPGNLGIARNNGFTRQSWHTSKLRQLWGECEVWMQVQNSLHCLVLDVDPVSPKPCPRIWL